MKSCILVLFLFIVNCSRPTKSTLAWEMDLPVIGSQSSPRAADLNNDGVLDLVMGAGKNEFQECEQGIIAIDGKSGSLLWQQKATDQVYGSATFLDVTGDGVADIFIGGRSPHLRALDGKTGAILWEYRYEEHQSDSVLQFARFNFNNGVLVPDQGSDGIPDLLTVNGGNATAPPNSEADRFPAVLMVFDTKSGSILASDTMPDGKESYMSPLYMERGSARLIIFGTGGETINGHLYLAELSDLMERKLSNARIIASETSHGFVAPPVLADISGDGIHDIVAISHGSSVYAIDGNSLGVLWKNRIEDTECSNSFGVGYFTGEDDVPDFFTFVSKGMWPNSSGSLQILLDGKDGHIAYKDTLGCTGFSSPVVYDLNGDGNDEAIISINLYDCRLGFTGDVPKTIENKLIAIDFKRKVVMTIDEAQGFKNIFTTPWIGDLDGDGYLDVVHCQYFQYSDLLNFLGMKVRRIDLPVRLKEPAQWGSYMGSGGDGTFGFPGQDE